MLYTIKNDLVSVDIDTHGAEIKAITYQNEPYLHDGDPRYWGRTAPILFPNVGAIKNGKTIINHKGYKLTKHGFLRDQDFDVVDKNEDHISFIFRDNEYSYAVYPFHFTVVITYFLYKTTITGSIKITSNNEGDMPFNLGLHPAFRIRNNEKFEDYQIQFDQPITCKTPKVNLEDGTIDFKQTEFEFNNLQVLPLRYEDYLHDAIIFDQIPSHFVTLKNNVTGHGLHFEFKDFTMLGIWTPANKKAPFICIEPWIGCGDATNTKGHFLEKKDLIHLQKDESKLIRYSITLF
jgi:galactose mutarotase-like enzyme